MVRTYEVLRIAFQKQVLSHSVMEAINKEKIDLIVTEASYRFTLVFSHILKAPIIQMSSFGSIGNNAVIGNSIHPILYPELIRHRYYNLTVFETLNALYGDIKLVHYMKSSEGLDNELCRKIVDPAMPTFSELQNNVNMLFLNLFAIWDSYRPVTPSHVYLGGLHQGLENDLPKELKTYLDSSINGVIYVSFGTNVNTSQLPKEKVDIFLKVLSKMPYDVLLKWNKDKLPGIPKNIRVAQWFPQADLLRHPKIKLFITQAGLQSTDEAISAGVPLIGIPMVFDQWCNAEKYVYHKIGMKVELESLTDEELTDAIHNTIDNESYRHNIAKLRSIMHDQPQRPLERAVWWTEHVLRHGGAGHLRAPAANMSYWEYLELELLAIILILSLVLIITLLFIFDLIIFYANKIYFNKLK